MRLTRALGLIVLLFAAVARVAAADGPAAIAGIAVNAQGLALPGVTVTASTAQGEPQVQVTDGEGRFTFDALAPGAYSVVFSLSGFDDKKFDSVTVPSNQWWLASGVPLRAGTPSTEIL